MNAEPKTEDQPAVPHFTRGGDDGRTTLGDFGVVAKDDFRLAAYGDCEEANSVIGTAMALAGTANVDMVATLASVQHDLFDLASDLMVPVGRRSADTAHITQGHIDRLERAIEHFSADLPRAEGFVLPGGTAASSLIFQARVVVRRAERTIWAAVEKYGDEVNPLAARYLNRLSALLFVLARRRNAEHGDTVWLPMASVTPPQDQPMEAGSATSA